MSARDLGVDDAEEPPAYDERRADAEVEWRLGGTGPLVVVAGPRRAGTSRAAARAARVLLGDHVVVVPDEGRPPIVGDLVTRAEQAMRRAEAPGAVVWLDGAGLATLDALTPALVAALPAGVRIVVTVEELLLCSWFPDPGTVGLLTAAGTLVRFGARDDARTVPSSVRAVLTPLGWGSLLPIALARSAADWRRAGVPRALDRELLLQLARVHRGVLGLGDSDAEDRALEAALDRAAAGATHGVRLLRPHGTGAGVHYTGVPGAEVVAEGTSTAAWAFPPALADRLDPVLDDAARDVVARTLLLRGAADLVVRLVDDGWGHPNPSQAGELAAAATRLGRPALAWHHEALGSSRDTHVRDAQRAIKAAAAPLPLRIVRRAACRPDPTLPIPQPRKPAERGGLVIMRVRTVADDTRRARARIAFDHAETAVRWAVVGRDLDGAWEWLAILESTDPPPELAERAGARRRQVEDLARRRARETGRAALGTEPPGFADRVDGFRREREARAAEHDARTQAAEAATEPAVAVPSVGSPAGD